MSESPRSPLADQLSEWLPVETESVDALDPMPAEALHRLTGVRHTYTSLLGPLDHWVYFHTWTPPHLLGPDGHVASGAHLPPLTNRRRMFAGGRCSYLEPLTFGSVATAKSSVAQWTIKRGRSGEFVLVTEQTRISQHGRLCLVEEQDLIYRSGPPDAPGIDPGREITSPEVNGRPGSDSRAYRSFDEVTLFQFSALTRNSHRIHFDAPYAQAVEGYRGLLVQGTLLVYCLAAQLDDEQVASLSRISFSIRQPVLAGERVRFSRGRDDGTSNAGRISWDLVGVTGGRRASLTAEVHDPSVAVR